MFNLKSQDDTRNFCEFVHFCSISNKQIYLEDYISIYEQSKKEIPKEFILNNTSNILFIIQTIKEFNYFFSLQLTLEQITSSFFMFFGYFVELMTGSGKTYAICLSVVWFVKLEKRKVHVGTFTDYLSRRDLNELKPFYEFLGIKSSFISRLEYENSDVIYGSISEFVFSYLSLIKNINLYSYVTINFLDVILLDESDGILIEKDLVPHIVNLDLKLKNSEFIKRNKILNIDKEKISKVIEFVKLDFFLGKDFFYKETKIIDGKKLSSQSILTLEGTKKLMKFQKKSIYFSNFPSSLFYISISILNALAKTENIDFVLGKDVIHIIDPYSGEKNLNSRYSNLEHEILEIIHLDSNSSLDSIYEKSNFSVSSNIYTYLRLYKMCIGVSGTNLEIQNLIYNLFRRYVVKIEHVFAKQIKIIDYFSFNNHEEKMQAVVKDIQKFYPRPILILTDDAVKNKSVFSYIKDQSFLKKDQLYRLDVLNEQKKTMIINRKAGKEGCVVVSTNIISRGVDIKVTHKYEKDFSHFQNWYNKQKEEIFISPYKNKCYIFDKIINIFKKELEEFNIRNKGLVVFLLQPYLDRRLDKQAAGRTARMGKDGHINKYVSFDDKIIVDTKNTKLSPFSLVNFYFPIFRFIKNKKIKIFEKIDKYIFLLVKRIQNTEYYFNVESKEENKLQDLLLNGYLKRKYLLFHTEKDSLNDFLNKLENFVNRIGYIKKKTIYDSINEQFLRKFHLRSVNKVISFIKESALKNESFFSDEHIKNEFLLNCGFLGYWKMIINLVSNIKSYTQDNLSTDNMDNYFLFFYSLILNSLLEKIYVIKNKERNEFI